MKQKKLIIDRLLETGSVDNFYAIDNYILRLGAIIYKLKQEGWRFDTRYGKELGKDRRLHKNYYYIAKKIPIKKLF